MISAAAKTPGPRCLDRTLAVLVLIVCLQGLFRELPVAGAPAGLAQVVLSGLVARLWINEFFLLLHAPAARKIGLWGFSLLALILSLLPHSALWLR